MSATKFRCVKTSSAKVVEQSISCEITKNIGWKVFPSTWNIGLNWPTLLLLSRRTLSALPNDVMSKIQCGQLHSELFRCRHSTLQSLAKRLFLMLVHRSALLSSSSVVSLALLVHVLWTNKQKNLISVYSALQPSVSRHSTPYSVQLPAVRLFVICCSEFRLNDGQQ